MSYPYRVRVSKTVETDVCADDKVTNKLNIDPILDERQMAELLKEALGKRGYKENDDGKWVKDTETGEHQEVDLETMEVTTTVTAEEKITKEKTLEVVGDAYARADRETQKEKHRQEAEDRLEKTLKITDDEKDAKKEELIRQIGEQLSESSDARREELLGIVAEVQGEALKEKAKGLGTVMSIEESTSDDGSEYELRIKITE
ncbi:MAG: hypothetical protein P1V97_38385 [Planctomycetota bacterium]|nr:hypothetical protein [Planctomycetota bacterium]